MPFKFFTSVACLGLFLTSSAVHAADNELYNAPPPDDAAFLRWIEPGAAPSVLGVLLSGVEGDAYRPVSAARTDGAKPGRYYTAALDVDGHVIVVEEPDRADRTKVLLTLLNLTDSSVRLVLAEQNVDVIGATLRNTAGARAVNPVAATLDVVSVDGIVLGQFDLQLRRGQNLTFVARPGQATLIENRFGTNIDG